jgi:protein TonB
MEANKILEADVLDIIFEGKNKSYGAYELRKHYSKRLTKALIITGSLLLLIFLGTLFANIIYSGNNKPLDVVDTQMAEIKTDEPPPPPPPPPPPTPPPPPEIKQVQFTPPKVVKDEEVKPDEKIEEIKEEAAISNKTVETDNTNQIVQAPVEDKGTQAVELPKVDEDLNKVFTKVEIDAQFPGGDAGWKRYLENNLNSQVPADNGADPGAYTVVAKFIVDRNGNLSDIVCVSDPGHGTCAEVLRLLKKTKGWTPAVQNGKHVIAYRTQKVTFVVGE